MSEFKLSAEGTRLTTHEFSNRIQTLPRKMELDDGRAYATQEERIAMLGFLLENLGVDLAVGLGDPQVWKDAIAKLDVKRRD